jgi:hypothetical protein
LTDNLKFDGNVAYEDYETDADGNKTKVIKYKSVCLGSPTSLSACSNNYAKALCL